MCLGIPGKIESVEEHLATVSFGSVKRKVDIRLINEPAPGDYVLVHAGFAINKISEDEAMETLALIEQIADAAGLGPAEGEGAVP